MRLHQYEWKNPEDDEEFRKKHSLAERMKAVDELKSEEDILRNFQNSNQTNDLRTTLDDSDFSDDDPDDSLSGNEAVDYATMGVDNIYLDANSDNIYSNTNLTYSNTNSNTTYADSNTNMYGSSGGCGKRKDHYCAQCGD